METQKYPVAGTDYPRTFQEFDIGLPAKKIAFSMLLSFDGPTVFVAPPAA